MKRIILILILITITFLTSCKKSEGYMFQANHRIKSSVFIDCFGVQHAQHTSDFFAYPEADEKKALAFYLKKLTQWQQENPSKAALMIKTDSLWVEYHCTVKEWNQKSL